MDDCWNYDDDGSSRRRDTGLSAADRTEFCQEELDNLAVEDQERINYLVSVAHHRLLESVTWKYLKELDREERIKEVPPREILNCLLKLVKLIKDLPTAKLSLVNAIRQKLDATVPISEIKNPSPES